MRRVLRGAALGFAMAASRFLTGGHDVMRRRPDMVLASNSQRLPVDLRLQS